MAKFNNRFKGLFEQGDVEEGGEQPDDRNYFEARFGWIFNAKRVADFENIKLEDCFNLGVIQFLNDLVYLREWDNNEKRMIKNARDSEQ